MTPFSPPIGNQSLRGCGHPGPQEFPHPVMVLEEGSVHFSLLAFWDPPSNQAHMVPPPTTNLHFKENPLHMFPIHLHFNSPWGGRVQDASPPSPLPP